MSILIFLGITVMSLLGGLLISEIVERIVLLFKSRNK